MGGEDGRLEYCSEKKQISAFRNENEGRNSDFNLQEQFFSNSYVISKSSQKINSQLIDIPIQKQKSIKCEQNFESKDLLMSCRKCSESKTQNLKRAKDQTHSVSNNVIGHLSTNVISQSHQNALGFCSKCLDSGKVKIKMKNVKLINHILQFRLQKYNKLMQRLKSSQLLEILEQLKQLNNASILDEECEEQTQTTEMSQLQSHPRYSKNNPVSNMSSHSCDSRSNVFQSSNPVNRLSH